VKYPKTDIEPGLKTESNSIDEGSQDRNYAASPEEIAVKTTMDKDKKRAGGILTYRFWKGVFDRLTALSLIVLLSPLLALITVVIRLDSPGSALFRQERVGKNGRRFVAYKFRTMYENNSDHIYREYICRYILENTPYQIDENGQAIHKIANDPRVTRFGNVLRRTNLDELPQFFNVLKGEMSLIGPRPEVPFALEMYQEDHWKRFGVTPGITGLWQVSGRKHLSFEDMIRLDTEYISGQSPILDIKILLLTIRAMLGRDGS
jgi:lipopolysaccharide/colanic/teichoic acid biosynthesis glycosyltransferase